jgi:hypothetical protein
MRIVKHFVDTLVYRTAVGTFEWHIPWALKRLTFWGGIILGQLELSTFCYFSIQMSKLDLTDRNKCLWTQGFGLSCLIRRTAPFSRLFRGDAENLLEAGSSRVESSSSLDASSFEVTRCTIAWSDQCHNIYWRHLELANDIAKIHSVPQSDQSRNTSRNYKLG